VRLLSILLPEGFDEADAALAFHTLRAARALGASFETELLAADPVVLGAHGLRVLPSRLGWDLARSEAIVIPAVDPARLPATLEDATLLRALARFDTGRRRVCALGNGAQLVARAGHVRDRRVAGAGPPGEVLRASGATVEPGPVVVDGHVITTLPGARARREGLLALVAALEGEAFAARLAAEGAARA